MKEIKETTNYSMFNKLPEGNRATDKKNIESIMRSISRSGNERIITLLKISFLGGKLFSADGNHYIEACRRLGLPVMYRIRERQIDTMEELIWYLIDLNNAQKAWTPKNFVDAWAVLKEDYIHLQNIIKEYNVGSSIISEVFCISIQNIKDGKFNPSLEQKEKADLYLKCVRNAERAARSVNYKLSVKAQRALIMFIKSIQKYNEQEMLVNLKLFLKSGNKFINEQTGGKEQWKFIYNLSK